MREIAAKVSTSIAGERRLLTKRNAAIACEFQKVSAEVSTGRTLFGTRTQADRSAKRAERDLRNFEIYLDKEKYEEMGCC